MRSKPATDILRRASAARVDSALLDDAQALDWGPQ
jgi:hypothetical protein